MDTGKRPPGIYRRFQSAALNQRLTVPQLRTLLLRADKLSLVLSLAVAVAAYAWFTQYQALGETRGERSDLEGRFQVVRDDLAYLDANDETAALQESLEIEQAKPEPESLPSREEAGEFSRTMVDYAAIQELPLTTFDRVDTSVAVGEQEYPSFRHSLEAQGSMEALIGLLRLVDEFPTAKVLELVFNRVAGAPTDWAMSLHLDVFYR